MYKQDSTLYWERSVKSSGYEIGIITDDGENFVIIEFWYYEDGNVVTVYNKDSNDFFIKGSEFKIQKKYLEHTISHKLWIENYEIDKNEIIIETLDKYKWSINLTKQEMINKSGNHTWYLILSMIILIFIDIAIIIWQKIII